MCSLLFAVVFVLCIHGFSKEPVIPPGRITNLRSIANKQTQHIHYRPVSLRVVKLKDYLKKIILNEILSLKYNGNLTCRL